MSKKEEKHKMNSKLTMDGNIFGTLWYTLESMNDDAKYDAEFSNKPTNEVDYFEVIKTNIDDDKLFGKATIKNVPKETIENWYWDNDLDIWCKEDK